MGPWGLLLVLGLDGAAVLGDDGSSTTCASRWSCVAVNADYCSQAITCGQVGAPATRHTDNARILLANPQVPKFVCLNMPALKAKKLRKLPREKVLLEL